jgi:hypothetical protein
MTDPISPVNGPSGARRVGRRSADGDEAPDAAGGQADAGGARLPAVIEPAPQPAPRSRRAAIAAFAAHLMGQGGQKRGLRGGPETLDKARSTYLETEWSGPADRRLRSGRITKTEV